MTSGRILTLVQISLLTIGVLAIFSDMVPAYSEGANESSAIKFDRVNLRSYSNAELVALLSAESIALNLQGTGGLTNMLPSQEAESPVTSVSRKGRASVEVELAAPPTYLVDVVIELVRRRAGRDLLDAFAKKNDWIQLHWIVFALSLLHDSEIDSIMAQYAQTSWGGLKNGKGFLAAIYLAEQGRCLGLEVLNRHYDELPISSLERVHVVSLFGKYRYLPAARNLVETIDAMLVTLGDATLEALSEMYPDAPVDPAAGSVRTFWEKYVAQHAPMRAATCKVP